jgi:polynucleotide 5'-hydroxyl-kinase GRC3/NOL9
MCVAEIVIPSAWVSLSEEGLEGTVMIIGASDTGKSTLAGYLYQELCRRGCRAAYLDADMGQSTLGLPTTLNLALSSEPGDDRFPPQGRKVTFFTGSITPRGHMLPTVVGSYRLQKEALLAGAQAVVVDTTGLVDRSQGGKALKQWKIELLAPSVVVGLQRVSELESILWPLRRDGRVRCIELSVSRHVVERSRQARIERRNARLAQYLNLARSRSVSLRQTAVYGMEQLAAGALVAFQDQEGFALGLGVVEEICRGGGTIVVRTPLPDLEDVVSVRFGAARWDLAHLSHQ